MSSGRRALCPRSRSSSTPHRQELPGPAQGWRSKGDRVLLARILLVGEYEGSMRVRFLTVRLVVFGAAYPLEDNDENSFVRILACLTGTKVQHRCCLTRFSQPCV